MHKGITSKPCEHAGSEARWIGVLCIHAVLLTGPSGRCLAVITIIITILKKK